MNKSNILLFLELKNKNINSLLNELRTIFNGKKSNSNIHITVRGPFRNKTRNETMEKIIEDVKYDVIKIEGIDYFENDNEYVVFIKIDSPNLEKIWKKSDYPKYKHGFNPHISLYRGNNKEKAMKIYDFLSKENISLLCESFEFVFYDLNQKSIKEIDESSPSLEGLEIAGRIKPGILERAKKTTGSITSET